MMLNKCLYCMRAALQNIRRNIVLNLLSMSVIAVTFILFVAFLLLFLNVSSLKKNLVERMQVIVFFDPGASPEAVDRSSAAIRKMPQVASTRFISRQEALEFLQSALRDQDGLLQGLSGNPLPDSLELKMKAPRDASFRHVDFDGFIGSLRSLEAVADIQYGRTGHERFEIFMNMLIFAGLCLGGLLFLCTLFIVANTIRLMVYIRRDEIEIMRLVGATNRFIQMPFCFEGIVQGLCGAAAALVFYYAAQQLLLDKASAFLQSYIGGQQFIAMSFSLSLYVLLLGALLGLAGSLLSVCSIRELKR